jgi:hypothetical protein
VRFVNSDLGGPSLDNTSISELLQSPAKVRLRRVKIRHIRHEGGLKISGFSPFLRRFSRDHLRMKILIPRTSTKRYHRTWARLIVCRSSSRMTPRMFNGPIFQTGSEIEESELWPTPHCPVHPLLLEYAGTTGVDDRGKPARGHNRGQDVHVLWRYERESGEFREIARVTTAGPSWYEALAPIVAREIQRPQIDNMSEARTAVGRLEVLMDGTLAELTDEGRQLALSFFYDQLVARMAEGASELSQAMRDSLFGGSEEIDWDDLRELPARKLPGRAAASIRMDSAAADVLQAS